MSEAGATSNPSAATPGASPAPQRSLGARASKAAVWSFAGFGASQVIRLGSNLVLTRLLFPEAFGLMAIAGVLMQGLMLFSDIGIGPSIIQNEKGEDRRFLDTAFTMQAVRGLVLTILSTVLAWPFAVFYDEPRLFAIVVVVGASSLVQGLNSTKVFTVGRRLDLKRLTLLELASQILGAIAMIAWALVSPTYWALAAGGLVTPLAKMLLGHLAIPGPRDGFDWHVPSARALAGFGRWIFLSTVMTFFAGQSDRLIFAKLVPLELLGVYSTAAMLAMMPPTLFGVIERRVVFPVYSTVHREGRALAPAFLRMRGGFLAGGGVLCAALIAAGPALIELLYDDRYREAGWMVQALTLGTWLNLLEMTYGAAHLATGRARWVAAASFAKVVGIVAGVTIGHTLGGFVGAVLGFSLSEAARYAVLAVGGRRMGLPGLGQDALYTLGIAVTALAGQWAGQWVGTQVDPKGIGGIWPLLASLTPVGLGWAPILLRTLGPALDRLRPRGRS
jgi:O-antigen/teichoic acid export membrane protein